MIPRPAARLLALLGAVGIGLFLFRAAPREVDLVYDLSRAAGVTGLEVDLLRASDGALVRHVEWHLPGGAASVRHAVKLPDGDYRIRFRIAVPGAVQAGERPLEVHEAGTVVLPLG